MANNGKSNILKETNNIRNKLFAYALVTVLITAAITSIANSSVGIIKNAYAPMTITGMSAKVFNQTHIYIQNPEWRY